ncbi:hypothetical protein L336_0567 [Candidatus Saccharimonas aalborgensis]|uniref:Uncharacterized protein n=1 Tax=Candidatus Saccharimonas aalborgensis TaxID=1332188 RepID=R4PVK5_9BACT|nr:hypothetical protein L336_0567 [Candidatus Saccharimonas aalborgensis]
MTVHDDEQLVGTGARAERDALDLATRVDAADRGVGRRGRLDDLLLRLLLGFLFRLLDLLLGGRLGRHHAVVGGGDTGRDRRGCGRAGADEATEQADDEREDGDEGETDTELVFADDGVHPHHLLFFGVGD